jgi:hypothetical protein
MMMTKLSGRRCRGAYELATLEQMHVVVFVFLSYML